MTTEFDEILDGYIDTDGLREYYELTSLDNWLTEDIVKLIQLMDAELQRRYDEEIAIRRECYEAFQSDLFNLDDEQDYSESDPW